MDPQRNALRRVPVEARGLGRRPSQGRRWVSQPGFGAVLLETERRGPTDTFHLHTQLLADANVICRLFSQLVPTARWHIHISLPYPVHQTRGLFKIIFA